MFKTRLQIELIEGNPVNSKILQIRILTISAMIIVIAIHLDRLGLHPRCYMLTQFSVMHLGLKPRRSGARLQIEPIEGVHAMRYTLCYSAFCGMKAIFLIIIHGVMCLIWKRPVYAKARLQIELIEGGRCDTTYAVQHFVE